jgi:site-specific recombinase XerD
MTILDFAKKNGHRIWDGQHYKNCMSQLTRMNGFEDFSVRSMSDIKSASIYEFIDHLSEQGLTEATLNRYISSVSSILKLAVDMEYIDHVPKIRWFQEDTGRPRYFSKYEVARLVDFFISAGKLWINDYNMLSLNSGMRLGEIKGISNPTAKTIGEITGCGNFVYLKNTKNGDERLVPLNKHAKKALRNLDYKPIKFFNHRKFYDLWLEARETIAPNDENFVFHVNRHTCATRLAMEFNTPTTVLCSIMGWKNPKIAMKYVHPDANSIASVMSKLED